MANQINRDVLDLIPAHFAERNKIVPVALENRVLSVVHGPNVDAEALKELSLLLRVTLHAEIRDEAAIEEMIRSNYGLGAQAIESLIRSGEHVGKDTARRRESEAQTVDLSAAGDDAAIVSFVNGMIQRVLEDGATDVHIEPYEDTVRVRSRIDGVLHDLPVPSHIHHFHAAIVSRLKVIAHLDIAEHRLPQDGRFRTRVNGEELDFRVSILPTPYGEAVNIRILANASILRGLDYLGLEAKDKQIVDAVLARPHGVVLVTGPTGSGKTTTLYSFLASLNSMERKIITIEDPIEYKLEGITQIQVRPRIGLDFARGLRSMLRHDPDVMMVGEIRDQETAETVIRVALTGHLVFSTVHTNDAPSTPARLMDMSVEPYLVASSVECVIAQRLVRLVCNDCAQPRDPYRDPVAWGVSDEGFEQIMQLSESHFRGGTGCPSCRMTGYRGRTAIFETMPMTPGLRDLIQHKQSAARIAAQARQEHFWPLRWKGLVLASTGKTSIEEVLRVTAADDIY